MHLPKLGEIATTNVVTVEETCSINDAVHLMAQRKLRDVIVTGELGLRILTSRELIQFRLHKVSFEQPLNQVSLNQVPTLSPQDNALQALEVIRNHPDEHLCLLDSAKNLVGIVSYTDLANCLDPQTMADAKTLADIMHSSQFVRVSQDDSIESVFQLLVQAHQTAAVVFEDDRAIGLITQSDIIKLFDQDAPINQSAKQVMSSPLITYPCDLTLSQALSQARVHQIKQLVVVASDSNYVMGLLHQKDLVAMVYHEWSERLAQETSRLQKERDLFAGGPVLVFKWLPQDGWPVEFASPNVEQVLGYTADDLMAEGFAFSSIVHPEDVDQVGKEVSNFLAEKRPFWEQLYRLVDLNGQVHWFYDYTRPIYNEQGEVEEILGYMIDQTDSHHAHQRLQQLAKNVPGMIYEMSLSVEGHMAFPYASEGIVDLFDLMPEDVAQDASEIFARVHPDDLTGVLQSTQRSAQTLESWAEEFRVNLPSGLTRWLRGQSTPTKREDGSIIWYGFVHDITNQKQQTLVLEQANQQFNLTMQATLIGLWTWDLQSNHLTWSDEAFSQLGYEPQSFDLNLEKFQSLMHPDDLDPMFQSVEQQIATDKTFVVEFRFRNVQGGWSWIQGRGNTTQVDTEGQPTQMMGTHLEITAQKQLQLQTDRQNALLQAVWQANQTFMTSQDIMATAEILLTKILAFTQSEYGFIGEVLHDQADNPYLKTLAMNLADSDQPSSLYDELGEPCLEFRNLDNLFGYGVLHQQIVIANDLADKPRSSRAPFGHPALKTFMGIPVFYGKQIVGFFGIANAKEGYSEQLAEELTLFSQNFSSLIHAKRLQNQQHALQNQMEAERDRAEAANRAKSEFLANMSHELRTPMNGILGLSELGLQQNNSEKMRDQLGKIHYSGRLLMGIINDILDFSKIEAGKMSLDPQPFYINTLVDNLYSLFSGLAKEKGLHLRFEQETVSKLCFYADELRLRQVLTNLLGNAIKFTQQGEVGLRITMKQEQIEFVVKDTGIGMSPVQQEHLFQAFAQADASTTRNYGGTGLGLVISKRLVHLMGGEQIHVESQLGEGSTFRFCLPLKLCTQSQFEQMVKVAQCATHQGVTMQFHGRVLLVEDNEINQEVAGEQLRQFGLDVILAENGQVAVELASTQEFELILMDIQMPVMDGYQATRAIRQQDKKIPIVALTAAAMVEDREKVIAVGMNEHLSKPLNSEVLQRVLSHYLSPVPLTPSDINEQSILEQAETKKMLDIERGIAQLAGNETLYKKLLQKFSDQLGTDYSSLSDLMTTLETDPSDSNFNAIQRRNHALKGVAGNLAAQGLFDISSQVDVLLKDKLRPSTDQIEALRLATSQTQTQITAYLQQDAKATPVASPDESHSEQSIGVDGALIRQLEQLKLRIEANEYIDHKELEQLQGALPAKVQSTWQAIIDDLDHFDFDSAQTKLNQLLQSALLKTLA